MAEYAAAVCAGRPCFHVSLVQDISPNCDCHGENDAPILPDIGMFASFDPVALDQACADACLNATPLPNSQLSSNLAKPGWNCHHDNFKDSNPNIEGKATLEQAEKIAAEGLPEKAFLRMKRSALGRRIRGLDSFDSTCFRLCAYHFSDFDYFRFPEVYRGISAEEICDFLRRAVRAERCSLSVIYPVNKEAQS